MRLLLAVIPALAAGYVAGRITAEAAPVKAAPARTCPVVTEAPPRPVTCRATLAADDVELLRRELTAAVRCEDHAPVATVPPEPTPEPPSPAAEAAARRVRDLLDRAVAAGVWRDDDALAFGQALAQLTPEGRQQAVRSLSAAVHEQHLTIRTHGAPF